MSVDKSVLISIQPKWCRLIMNGEKTYELRKNTPKLTTPFKCYIYCTKEKSSSEILLDTGHQFLDYTPDGKCATKTSHSPYNGHILGEFICDYIYTVTASRNAFDDKVDVCCSDADIVSKSCVDEESIIEYFGDYKDGYAWHIKDFKLYPHPVLLGCFTSKQCTEPWCKVCEHSTLGLVTGGMTNHNCSVTIKRAPQSWCYCWRKP